MERDWRILVVDDEPRGVELMVRALRRVGEVRPALSGEEGWEIARGGEIDLVVSDQRMPGISGVELLARIANLDETTGRIILTGYADVDTAVAAINDGQVHAYLNKPCPPDQLQASVRSVLERVRLARDNRRLLVDLTDTNRKLREAVESLAHAQEQAIAAERLAAIGRMSAMVVHDLRGPLTVLRASGSEVGRVAKETDHELLRELSGEIVEESDRMNRTCEELLDVARASESQLRPTAIDLDGLVEDIAARVVHKASLAGVRVDLDVCSGAAVHVDEDRMCRALVNLANNGIEAMEEGGVLRLETRVEAGMAVISILDTGCGIPDEIADRLFEPFVTAGKSSGTGLGLAVVKAVLDRHRGEIEVGKAEGGGTAFHLRLPLGEAEEASG